MHNRAASPFLQERFRANRGALSQKRGSACASIYKNYCACQNDTFGKAHPICRKLTAPPKGVKRGIQIICVPYFTGLSKKICASKDFLGRGGAAARVGRFVISKTLISKGGRRRAPQRKTSAVPTRGRAVGLSSIRRISQPSARREIREHL